MIKRFLRSFLILASLIWVSRGESHESIHRIRASFYDRKFEGHKMADGRTYHSYRISVASLEFPLGTQVKITNLHNRKSIVATVTDRGPWHTRFRLDLSPAAFEALGMSKRKGWGWVKVEALK